VVNEESERELANLIYEYGEEGGRGESPEPLRGGALRSAPLCFCPPSKHRAAARGMFGKKVKKMEQLSKNANGG
jgi:hypothetical protein